MDYIKTNKEAWEEAFEHRHPEWGEDNYMKLSNEPLPFFTDAAAAKLKSIDFSGKRVGQFCCNNGRELLSLMKLGAESGVGFDIADNIIGQAKDTTAKANIQNCEFVCCNILDIPEQYHNSFDFIMFTIGAITWFKDLKALFKKVSACLKPQGILLINDFHPMMNMLPLPEEPEYDADHLNKVTYSYFRQDPWIENNGMSYMSEEYASKTFTSFSHTTSSIINAVSAGNMRVEEFHEYDYDIGLTEVYNGKGFPLSFLLTAEKL